MNDNIWIGWIYGDKEKQHILEEIGITFTEYNEKNKEWLGCKVTNEQLDKLDKYWDNTFIWGLQ